MHFPPAVYSMQGSLDQLQTQHGSRPVTPASSYNAAPQDISPLAHNGHSRQASLSSTYDPRPLTPSSTYSRYPHQVPRASSPASSVASSSLSSITSLSGSISVYSESGCSSVTGASSPTRSEDIDELASSLSPESRSAHREKNRKNKLFNVDRKAICQYAEQNPSRRQEDIAMHFGVERSTVSKVLKVKSLLLSDAWALMEIVEQSPLAQLGR